MALYAARAQTAIAAAGGRMIAPMGAKTMTFVGETPRRIGIPEWDSVEQAQG